MQPTPLVQPALISAGFALGGGVLGTLIAGGVLGALITGAFNLRTKRNEYVLEYYKTVIQRRIVAYERLESLIIDFRVSVVDRDNKPYHLPFSRAEAKQEVFKSLFSVMSQGLWLSEEAFDKTRDLSYLLLRMPDAGSDAIDFGKLNYEAIAVMREALERILAQDMIDLHNVGRFLNRKKKNKSGFIPVQLYPKEKNQSL